MNIDKVDDHELVKLTVSGITYEMKIDKINQAISLQALLQNVSYVMP